MSNDIPNGALLRRQVIGILGKQIELDARVRPVGEVVSAAAAVHGAIVRGHWHRRKHVRVNVVRKDPFEFQMIEWRFDGPRSID